MIVFFPDIVLWNFMRIFMFETHNKDIKEIPNNSTAHIFMRIENACRKYIRN